MKRNKRTKNKKRRYTKHHITPSSRGGTGLPRNIAMVKKIPHQNYHILFGNKTPTEIIEYLVDTYWKGDWDYVRQAYEQNNSEERMESSLEKLIEK